MKILQIQSGKQVYSKAMISSRSSIEARDRTKGAAMLLLCWRMNVSRKCLVKIRYHDPAAKSCSRDLGFCKN